jgi:16S rRNA (guanine527-N7)-methyltransferase
MTSNEFHERLAERMRAAGLPQPEPGMANQLEAYFELLRRWNAKMNLTALPLDQPTERTFDRLLVEPLVAAGHTPPSTTSRWVDLGSGGGSPAIPMKVALPDVALTMVEIKARKAAFLREAVRVLQLPEAAVANEGFERVAEEIPQGSIDFVTVRALRCDAGLLTAVERLLSSRGMLMLFQSNPTMAGPLPAGLVPVRTVELPTFGSPWIVLLQRVFHVEQPN